MLDDEEEVDPVKEIKLTHSAVDCTFIGDHLVLFLCSELDAQLVLYDLLARKNVKNLE